eukprot:TRINITY_DN276_c0_g1_i1.p1 TRINITY_DN276_c0_g1~~TRINITY_DN276_c0_g1_i1.p1  ORF type:complete len:457 (+),score=176.33 TRINITY_DN276_c0_g1_i1:25-1371(+)
MFDFDTIKSGLALLACLLLAWKFLFSSKRGKQSSPMSGGREVRIIGTGRHFPPGKISNKDALHYCNIDATEEWMETKIGIKTRHSARAGRDAAEGEEPFHGSEPRPAEGCRNSDLCAAAITKALARANLDKSELDLIIISTCTPDYPVPSTATIVQSNMEIPECAAVDIRSACCGAMQATITAMQYCRTGYYRTVAICGCDVGTIFGNLDKDSPTYCRQDKVNACMIGDGAGAFILRGFDKEAGEKPHGIEILYSTMNSIGMGKPFGMYLPLGGSCLPATVKRCEEGLQFFKHDYRGVLEHGPELYLRALQDMLDNTEYELNDINIFIPHQANGSISQIAEKLKFPAERLFNDFTDNGNTANASLPIAVDELVEKNELPEGALVALGAAESTKWLYAVLLLRWSCLAGENDAKLGERDPLYARLYARALIALASFALRVQKLKKSLMG